MAIQLSVTQFGGKVFVYANNTSIGSGRLGEGSGARMVEFNYPGGPASAHATAKYWEVDQSAKSLPVNVS